MITPPPTRPAKADDMLRSLLDSAPALPPPRARTPVIGFLSPRAVEVAFIWLMYLSVGFLVLLSVFGTFYALSGESAPLATPLAMFVDGAAASRVLLLALAIQVVLGLSQYGARLMARRDRRWWILYLASLGISVYYNIQAYLGPLVALNVPAAIALILIIVGDVLPERVAIRSE